MILLACVIAGFGSGNILQTAADWIWASFYGSGGDYTQPFYIKGIGATWFLWASFWGGLFLQALLNCHRIIRVLGVAILFLVGYISAQYLFWFPFSIQAGCCATLFMYIGHFVRAKEPKFRRLTAGAKTIISVVTFALWGSFIWQFRTFWFVECDFGRGLIDVCRSLCACYCITIISGVIDRHMEKIAGYLAFLGRYSIIVLCVHITELKLIHWKKIAEKLLQYNIPWAIGGGLAVALKLIFILMTTVLIVRIPGFRKVFIPDIKHR